MKELPEHFREYRVKIIPAADAPLPAKYPDNLGYRTKFGGKPDHIQDADGDDGGKSCDVCGQAMHFIAQIDSFENDHPKPHFMFGDVGMIYVWYCFHCGEPCATTECH
jgi:hypothetical protein